MPPAFAAAFLTGSSVVTMACYTESYAITFYPKHRMVVPDRCRLLCDPNARANHRPSQRALAGGQLFYVALARQPHAGEHAPGGDTARQRRCAGDLPEGIRSENGQPGVQCVLYLVGFAGGKWRRNSMLEAGR
jgi:hypothetical protein